MLEQNDKQHSEMKLNKTKQNKTNEWHVRIIVRQNANDTETHSTYTVHTHIK